jgi:hypothetical protein
MADSGHHAALLDGEQAKEKRDQARDTMTDLV